jgi:hypothetical protein
VAHVVEDAMLSAGEDGEVARGVVERVTVGVVDLFAGTQGAAEGELGAEAMETEPPLPRVVGEVAAAAGEDGHSLCLSQAQGLAVERTYRF